MGPIQRERCAAPYWAVAVLGAALLGCGGVTAFQPTADDPAGETWVSEPEEEPEPNAEAEKERAPQVADRSGSGVEAGAQSAD